MVKQITSTDKIHAERKYKDPEDFTPSHTLILYTNYLPRVGSADGGTWRRLVAAPFRAKISGSQEVKNYAETLVAEAGGAIISWVVEGAIRFIEAGHKLNIPDAVQRTIEQYKKDNDWMGDFIAERCTESGSVGSGRLYEEFRRWADDCGEYKRNRADFKAELERRGFRQHRSGSGIYWYGINLLGFSSMGSRAPDFEVIQGGDVDK